MDISAIPKKKKLINMAQYIYDQKVLYIHKHDGYKLMEFSSIHAELGGIEKACRRRIHERERGKREQAEKVKSKY